MNGYLRDRDSLQIWETVYFHELENHRKIVEFYSSTGLKPYLEGLPSEELRDRFKADLENSFRTLFPAQNNGRILLPFRRLFVIAMRDGRKEDTEGRLLPQRHRERGVKTRNWKWF